MTTNPEKRPLFYFRFGVWWFICSILAALFIAYVLLTAADVYVRSILIIAFVYRAHYVIGGQLYVRKSDAEIGPE